MAHRGASRDAPENTTPAFELAWQQGADAVECDVHLTKDKKIVCIHDPDTKRVSGKRMVVRDADLNELRKLDVGSWRGKNWEGVTIPTLLDVFSLIPEQKKIVIEIKCDTEIIPHLLEDIEKSGLKYEQIVVISFDGDVLYSLKTKAPQFKTLWLSDVKKTIFGKTTPSLNTVLSDLKKIHADGFSSSYRVVDEPFVRKILTKGYEYHVWTVDDINPAIRFRNWGVQSITTNTPGRIKKMLNEHDDPADIIV